MSITRRSMMTHLKKQGYSDAKVHKVLSRMDLPSDYIPSGDYSGCSSSGSSGYAYTGNCSWGSSNNRVSAAYSSSSSW